MPAGRDAAAAGGGRAVQSAAVASPCRSTAAAGGQPGPYAGRHAGRSCWPNGRRSPRLLDEPTPRQPGLPRTASWRRACADWTRRSTGSPAGLGRSGRTRWSWSPPNLAAPRMNGTKGTDHGTASTALVLGGRWGAAGSSATGRHSSRPSCSRSATPPRRSTCAACSRRPGRAARGRPPSPRHHGFPRPARASRR